MVWRPIFSRIKFFRNFTSIIDTKIELLNTWPLSNHRERKISNNLSIKVLVRVSNRLEGFFLRPRSLNYEGRTGQEEKEEKSSSIQPASLLVWPRSLGFLPDYSCCQKIFFHSIFFSAFILRGGFKEIKVKKLFVIFLFLHYTRCSNCTINST